MTPIISTPLTLYIQNQITGFLGKMKSETGSTPLLEFVGLKAKMYSLLCENRRQKKSQGNFKNLLKNTFVMKIFSMFSRIQLLLPLQNSVILS